MRPSDIKILDPIRTTAYIVRNHGYMIYDTLFAIDANGEVKPQMVGKYDASPDRLIHTFTLPERPHLAPWPTGQGRSCVASVHGGRPRDSTGKFVIDSLCRAFRG